MIDRQRIAIGVGLIGVGGSIAGFGANEVDEKFKSLGLPSSLFSAVIYFGVLLLVIGFIFILISVELPGRSEVRYEFRRVKRHESAFVTWLRQKVSRPSPYA